MAVLAPGTTLSVQRADNPLVPGREEGWRLVVGDDERGRVRGSTVEVGDLDLTVRRTGERFELVTATGTPVLRFDPAGRKATTLTTASGRFRLARQRPRPLLHRWTCTQGVHGDVVLTVSRTPLGTRVQVAGDTTVAPGELALLAVGAIVEVLDLEPVPAAA